MKKGKKVRRPTIKDVTRLQLQCAELSERLATAEAVPARVGEVTTRTAFEVIEANIVDRQTRIAELRSQTRVLVEEVENLQLEAARLGRG